MCGSEGSNGLMLKVSVNLARVASISIISGVTHHHGPVISVPLDLISELGLWLMGSTWAILSLFDKFLSFLWIEAYEKYFIAY